MSSLDVFVELASRGKGLGTFAAAVSLLLGMNAGDVLEKVRHHLPALSADLGAEIGKDVLRRRTKRDKDRERDKDRDKDNSTLPHRKIEPDLSS